MPDPTASAVVAAQKAPPSLLHGLAVGVQVNPQLTLKPELHCCMLAVCTPLTHLEQ